MIIILTTKKFKRGGARTRLVSSAVSRLPGTGQCRRCVCDVVVCVRRCASDVRVQCAVVVTPATGCARINATLFRRGPRARARGRIYAYIYACTYRTHFYRCTNTAAALSPALTLSTGRGRTPHTHSLPALFRSPPRLSYPSFTHTRGIWYTTTTTTITITTTTITSITICIYSLCTDGKTGWSAAVLRTQHSRTFFRILPPPLA